LTPNRLGADATRLHTYLRRMSILQRFNFRDKRATASYKQPPVRFEQFFEPCKLTQELT
jgi:hypothetical protein